MQTKDNVESPKSRLSENSHSAPGATVVTLGAVLKFALFFSICFLMSILVIGFVLGYFGPLGY